MKRYTGTYLKSLLFASVCVILFSVVSVSAQTLPADTELTAAVIIEQNVTFAVVLVKETVFADKSFADQLIGSLEPTFGGIPVVLMVQDAQGTPTYYGRTDLSNFLANVPLEAIPWKKYVLKEQNSGATKF